MYRTYREIQTLDQNFSRILSQKFSLSESSRPDLQSTLQANFNFYMIAQ